MTFRAFGLSDFWGLGFRVLGLRILECIANNREPHLEDHGTDWPVAERVPELRGS